jgi:ribosomal protein L11 methyltransferase
MDWIELTVLTTTEGADIVSAQLIEAGSAGTVIEDRNDIKLNQRPEGQWDIIDESIALKMSEDVRVTGYYPLDERANDAVADVRARIEALKSMGLGLDLGKLEILSARVDEEDWAEYWKASFKPFKIGERLVIRPSWTSYDAQPGDLVIELDPGMAFGTGTHETTALCALWLEELVTPGVKAMDLGTGAGILAISAALLGAKDVLATDIDPVAVRVARENVHINGVEHLVRTAEADVLAGIGETADLVIANIITDVILMIAPAVFRHVNAGGAFLCSGISANRGDEVESALKTAGFTGISRREKGEWAAFAAVKPCAAS